MNYGTLKDWQKYEGNMYCGICAKRSNWETNYVAEFTLDEEYLCNDCYQKLVVTPNLKLLTKEDLTDDLIGKEVICVNNANWNTWLIVNKKYTVVGIYEDAITVIDKANPATFHFERFALPYEAPKPQMQERCVTVPVDNINGDINVTDGEIKLYTDEELVEDLQKKQINILKSQPEITHSCELEFPNGETVTIPGPEGPEWTAETKRYDWPQKHFWEQTSTPNKMNLPGHMFIHEQGKLLHREYFGKMSYENPRIVSITKWTRDPIYQPSEREETFEERAKRRYPSRWR